MSDFCGLPVHRVPDQGDGGSRQAKLFFFCPGSTDLRLEVETNLLK